MKILVSMAITSIVAIAGANSAKAQSEFEKNIMTGGTSGTYIQIGSDLAELGTKCGETLTVQQSAGSLENILAVRERRNTQFGIVQSDVLDYLNKYSKDDEAIQQAIAGVVIAAPLYNEEVQVLAKREFESLADLAGQRVSVGVENSGTFLTASLVLDLTETVPSERIFMNSQDSLAALLNNEIDTFFYVAGAPTALLTNEDIDGDAFHLLPLTEAILTETYTTAQLPAGTYPFQANVVDLVAVKAVLMTYEYDRSKNTYHNRSCDAVADFSHLIASGFADLKENGHPKWNDVDLTDIPPGWTIGNCVNRGLAPDYTSQCTSRLAEAAVPAEPDANAIYREQICKTLGTC
jgi:TRAP transporter TAXI family solute receptor